MILFAHGDPISLVVIILIEILRKAADNAGPIVAVIFQLIGIVLVLPAVVLVLDFVTGLLTAIFIRKKRWLFLIVIAEALALYIVFCVPAALMLLFDWPAFWAWLTIGLGGAVSMLAGLIDSSFIVGVVAIVARLLRKEPSASEHVNRESRPE